MYAGHKHEASVARHSNAWLNGLKNWLADDAHHWETLLADVPGRPWSASPRRPLASTASDDLLGLLAKYNLQYRRPAPHNFTMLDGWTLNRMTNIDDEVLQLFTGPQYNIATPELRHTHVWQQSDVDWNSWSAHPSSVLVPVFSPHSPTSAVGEEQYYCRSVTTTTFPAFCYLLGEQFTAAEIEAAWLEPPACEAGGKSWRQWPQVPFETMVSDTVNVSAVCSRSAVGD